MVKAPIVMYLTIVCFLLVSARAQASQGLTFSSPSNETSRAIHAPVLGCARVSPSEAAGYLLSYEALRRVLIYGDRIDSAMKALAPKSIVLITSTNLVDGNLVPFLNDTKQIELVTSLVHSWKPRAVIIRNTVSRDGGQSEFGMNNRDWCYTATIMWVEVGFYDGLMLERISAETSWCLPMNLMLELAQNESFVSPDLYYGHLRAGDISEWQKLRKSGFMVFWRLFMSLLSGSTAVIALYKLAVYVKIVGPALTVPQLALGIIFIGSLFRCIYTAIDPIYMGYTDILARQAHMLPTIHLPIFCITTMLLALYWKEVMDSSNVHASGFLLKMRIPFFLISFIVVFVEFLTSSLRAAEFGTMGPAVMTVGALYVVIMGATSIFFVIMGIMIIKRLKHSASSANVKSSSRSRATLQRTTVLVMTTALFGFIFVAGLAQTIFDDWFWSTRGFIVTWSFTYLGAFGGALVQVLTVRVPDDPKASSSTGATMSTGSQKSTSRGTSGAASNSDHV